ncbi:MAG: HU family DNA-binding protein [Mycoplasmataceae bacterium]|jgi:DNA-binding protein HU-beta|nr:HU family DNA-binding protein [Mycoplasmataceae bacterium]
MGKPLTKNQIVAELSTKTSLSKKDVANVLSTLETLAEKRVVADGQFRVMDLGKLVVRKTKARMGRNPATGKEIKIPAKTVVKFRVAKAIKQLAKR